MKSKRPKLHENGITVRKWILQKNVSPLERSAATKGQKKRS